MTWLLRIAELALVLFLVAWTVVFPVATLLSLLITLPLVLIISARAARVRPDPGRA